MSEANRVNDARLLPSSMGDVNRSPCEAKSNDVARLPRMRRCRCCLHWKRAPNEKLRYRVVKGAGVYTGLSPTWHGLFMSLVGDRELERVTLVPEWNGPPAHRYERIRDGRWVDWFHADHGHHSDGAKWQPWKLGST